MKVMLDRETRDYVIRLVERSRSLKKEAEATDLLAGMAASNFARKYDIDWRTCMVKHEDGEIYLIAPDVPGTEGVN